MLSSRRGPTPPPCRSPWKFLEPGTFENTSEFVGSLQAEQRVELPARSQWPHYPKNFCARPGDAVRAGQPVMQLKPDQAQARVAGAQAGAEAARYGRDAAQAQLEAAQAQLLQAEADVQLAEVEFRRTKKPGGRTVP